jgi:pimeloyl-ACP methyl ester carboxylesterase
VGGYFEDWIATLAPLSATWRTAVYDHRGTGETVVVLERITHDALVDDVFAVMDALSIKRCVLAGFSRGRDDPSCGRRSVIHVALMA